MTWKVFNNPFVTFCQIYNHQFAWGITLSYTQQLDTTGRNVGLSRTTFCVSLMTVSVPWLMIPKQGYPSSVYLGDSLVLHSLQLDTMRMNIMDNLLLNVFVIPW